MLSWLFRSKKHSLPQRPATANPRATPAAAEEDGTEGTAQQGREQRKAERHNRREALFAIVREVMLHAGVLSSAYKFKVLSIDQEGQRFLVLLDLAHDALPEKREQRQQEIEGLIAEAVSKRCEAVVQAVYWRHDSAVKHFAQDEESAKPAAPAPSGAAASEPQSVAVAGAAAAVAGGALSGEAADTASRLEAMLAELRALRQSRETNAAAAKDTTAAEPAEQTFASTQALDGQEEAERMRMHQATLAAMRGEDVPAMDEDARAFASTQILPDEEEAVADDEIQAFQQALTASAADLPSIFVEGAAGRPQTAEPEADAEAMNVDLSATQYGKL